MRGDFKIVWPTDGVFSVDRIVAAGAAATIKAGEPTKQGTSGAVAIMADGEGTTSERFTGIAKSDSTDTVAAAGVISVYLPLPGVVYSGKAKSSTAADTQAEVDALNGKRVVFDLTTTAWTIDTAAADGATNTVVIVGGDYQSNRVYFVVSPTGTYFE